MEASLKKKIEEWMIQCPFENLKSEVQNLVDEGNEKELSDRFYKDIEFGTGGMRAVMAAGPNRINEEIIGKTTQGLANYILSQDTGDYAKRGVAIAHDSRNNHELYLKEITKVFAGNNIKVHIFKSIRPTPLLSYAVRELNAISGIVITASHNTSEYNGYKVYWEDGGQVIPPHDSSIINEVRKIGSYKDEVKRISFEEAQTKGLVNYISDDLIDQYYKSLKDIVVNPNLIEEYGKKLKIIYTPLHGASGDTVMGMFKALGFTAAQAVPEQIEPDGNFSTVESPNPEEASALTMGLNLAKKEDADLVFANDPDGDRMAVGVKSKTGDWELLNGNQMGSIMAWYLLSQKKEKGTLPKNGALIKTIVTTDLQSDIANSFGVKTFNTLTGFKFIGGVIRDFELKKEAGEESYEYIFGGEESYGYLPSPIVRDKDGVMALGLAAEIALYAKSKNKTLIDLLHDIYQEFGLYKEGLVSITLKGQDGVQRIKEIMDSLRSSPPTEIDGESLLELRDYDSQETKNKNGDKTGNIDLPKSNVIALDFDQGTKITARPSGTEPKIKFYFSVKITGEGDIPSKLKLAEEKIDRLKQSFQKITNT